MDIQNNHITNILNAKYDLVTELYNICQKAEYGDTDCCMKGMYAKAKLIDRLQEYVFPKVITTTVTPTVYSKVLLASTTNTVAGNKYNMYVNGVLVSTYTFSDPNLRKQYGIHELIIASGFPFIYHTNTISGSTTFDQYQQGYYVITFPCGVTSLSIVELSITIDVSGNTIITSTTLLLDTNPSQAGLCSYSNSIVYNCITNADLPKMYEVLNKL